jgi:hypothetical protein
MSSSSSARQLGDEAQQYLFWLWAARMLANNEITAVGYETGYFKAFDDVGVRYKRQRTDGLGGFIDEDHFSAKFSVAGGKVLTGESLADPAMINADTISLLERLKDAVDKADAEKRKCRFILWSPWPIEQNSLFSKLIESGQGALKLKLLFEGKTERSESWRLRDFWAKRLGVESDNVTELERILKPLRIQSEFRTFDNIRADLADKLPMAGLKTVTNATRSDPYCTLIQRLSREGPRWFTLDDLELACKHDDLWIGRPQLKSPATRIGIRSFLRFAEGLEDDTDEMTCLAHLFSGRNLKPQHSWNGDVLPSILSFLNSIVKPGGLYEVYLPSVGSIAFTCGYLSEPKLGATFSVIQATVGGRKAWQCGVSENSNFGWTKREVEFNHGQDQLAVSLSVTHSISADVDNFVSDNLKGVVRILHLSAPVVGHSALRDGSHTFDAAQEAVNRIAELCRTSKFERLHIFWAAPNAFAFMFGQLSRLIGRIVLYEFDFESIDHRRYQESLTLDPSLRLG